MTIDIGSIDHKQRKGEKNMKTMMRIIMMNYNEALEMASRQKERFDEVVLEDEDDKTVVVCKNHV